MSNPFEPDDPHYDAWNDTEPDQEESAPDTWMPIDLGPYLRGEVTTPEPTLGLARSDGLRLIYPGKEHSIIGEMESGKTWFAAACVSAEMMWGRSVLYIHFEETDPSDLIGRLRALGVIDPDIVKFLRFVCPSRPVSGDALRALLNPVPSLVIFDGVNEAMSLHRWAIREEDGAAMFRRHLVMPCVRVGAATLSCDHVVKSVEARGRHALGSIHKGNGITGTLILLENADPFGRGARGRSNVFVTKDRPGYLRQHGKPDRKMPGKTFMGALVVDDTQTLTPELELRFWAPAPPPTAEEIEAIRAEPTVDEVVLAAVVKIIAMGKVANLRTIRAALPIRKETVDDALARLVFDDALSEASGSRGARVFTVPGDQLSESAR